MKKFSTEIYGYSKKEVNSFVMEVTREYENVLNRLKVAENENERIKQDLVKYQNMENTLNRAILIAEEAGNQIKKLAHDEYQRIIDEAKRNASRLVSDSLNKVDKINETKEQLERRVEIYKRRVKQTINEQLELIDEIDKIEY